MAPAMRCVVATARLPLGEGALLVASVAPVALVAQAITPGPPSAIAGATEGGWHALWPFVSPLGNEWSWRLWLAEKYVAWRCSGPEAFVTLVRLAAQAVAEKERV